MTIKRFFGFSVVHGTSGTSSHQLVQVLCASSLLIVRFEILLSVCPSRYQDKTEVLIIGLGSFLL